VDLTYRSEYVEDVEGQWQGYKDGNAERAWGLTGWGRRAGTGAYLDWVMGNAMLPAIDPLSIAECDQDDPPQDCNPEPEHTGIQKIDREEVEELSEIVTRYGGADGRPVTSLDVLGALREHAGDVDVAFLDDLFERIAFLELGLESARARALAAAS